MENKLFINDINAGISKIELSKSDLLIIDKTGKYCLQVCVFYNWKDINNLQVGEKKNIDFNEYCLAENNEPALVWPTECFVKRINEEIYLFSLNFSNLDEHIHYMNKRNHFDIKLDSLKCEVFINLKKE